MREILVSPGSFQHSLSLVNGSGSAGGDHSRVEFPRLVPQMLWSLLSKGGGETLANPLPCKLGSLLEFLPCQSCCEALCTQLYLLREAAGARSHLKLCPCELLGLAKRCCCIRLGCAQ